MTPTAEATITPSTTATPTTTPTPVGGDGILLYTLGLDIYTMSGDGADSRLLISAENIQGAVPLPEARSHYLEVSPDGKRAVIYSRISSARPMKLTVFDLSFENIHQFSDENSRNLEAHWSYDGENLLIVTANYRTEQHETLHIMDTAGNEFGSMVTLGRFNRPYAAAWAPEAGYLLIVQSGAAYRVEPDGRKTQLSCPFCNQLWPADPSGAAFSDDGSKIAIIYEYDQKPGAEHSKMVVANSDFSEAEVFPLGVYAQQFLHWSPDNSKIAFLRYNISGTESRYIVGGGGVSILDITNGNVLNLKRSHF